MRVLHLVGACIGLLIAFSPTQTLAAPTCNEAAYGSKCMRCYGWAGMPSWNSQACYYASNPNVRFACSANKCGPFKVQGGPKADFKR